MWVYLDDVRNPPAGYVLARTYEEAIKLLETGEVVGMSFDHDLGYEITDEKNGIVLATEKPTEKTGYDVLKWIEEKVVTEGFRAPEQMLVHSANPVGVKNMTRVIESIHRYRLGLAEC